MKRVRIPIVFREKRTKTDSGQYFGSDHRNCSNGGNGFRANEVKELANQTARATEDIGKRIQNIQINTENSVKVIANITKSIHNINDIPNTIAASVEEQSVTTSEISLKITEASRGTEDISINIVSMAEAANET